jgi:hypothetical protein
MIILLSKTSMASDNSISVRAIRYIIIGHQMHHLRIIEDWFCNYIKIQFTIQTKYQTQILSKIPH